MSQPYNDAMAAAIEAISSYHPDQPKTCHDPRWFALHELLRATEAMELRANNLEYEAILFHISAKKTSQAIRERMDLLEIELGIEEEVKEEI